MSRAVSSSFTLPFLSVSPAGAEFSSERLHATQEELCVLVLEAAEDQKPLDLDLQASVIRDWHITAANAGVGLVVLLENSRIELYSTRAGRRKAFAQPISAIKEWSARHPECGQFRLTMHRGIEVARRLCARAAGLETSLNEQRMALDRIRIAVEVASRAGSLSPALGSLLRTAHKVGRRVSCESLVGNPVATEPLSEMAQICATRITEEELLFWQAKQAERYRAMARGRTTVTGTVRSSGTLKSLAFYANPSQRESGMCPRRDESDERPSGALRVAAASLHVAQCAKAG